MESMTDKEKKTLRLVFNKGVEEKTNNSNTVNTEEKKSVKEDVSMSKNQNFASELLDKINKDKSFTGMPKIIEPTGGKVFRNFNNNTRPRTFDDSRPRTFDPNRPPRAFDNSANFKPSPNYKGNNPNPNFKSNPNYVPKTQNIFDKQEAQKENTYTRPTGPNPNYKGNNHRGLNTNSILGNKFGGPSAQKPDFKKAFPVTNPGIKNPYQRQDYKKPYTKRKKVKTFKDNQSNFNQHNFTGRLDHLDFDSEKRIINKKTKKVIQNKSIIKSININKSLSLKELAAELTLKLYGYQSKIRTRLDAINY